MIESIAFRNFKVLRQATLPLGRLTVLVGPNGSGKSTALQALEVLQRHNAHSFTRLASVGTDEPVEVTVQWNTPPSDARFRVRWRKAPEGPDPSWTRTGGGKLPDSEAQVLWQELSRIRVYSLDASAIAMPVTLTPRMELARSGEGLAGVLDRLRDKDHERFERLNAELGRVLPEFDRILFDVPTNGTRAFLLRTRNGHHAIPATDLSQGTLFALVILTLANLPELPPLVCIEEPERGIHPRLLRRVQDALYRLSHPEASGEKRAPVQVVVTTQSPYFLDLFKNHPEEIVLAEKVGLDALFTRLTDRGDIEDILANSSLGEVWYSGILGGVPVNS